ncbi:hypothetical protein ACWC0C_07090 [Streptomyces sp. NPDC001709]
MTAQTMITTPARNAMAGHGLTDAVVIVDGAGVAAAYAVFCPATERYSVMTLDGRWIIPGTDGYRSRGPVTRYVRTNVATLRPEGMRVMEPARCGKRVSRSQYGRSSYVTCGGSYRHNTHGTGIECDRCRTSVWGADLGGAGFTLVTDGRRGTHVLAWALDRSHGVEWGTVPSSHAVASVIMPGESVADSVGETAAARTPGMPVVADAPAPVVAEPVSAGEGESDDDETAAYDAALAECRALRDDVARMRSVDRMERADVPHGNATAREVADAAAADVQPLMSRAAGWYGLAGSGERVRAEILPALRSAREAVAAYDAHRSEEAREHALRVAAVAPVAPVADAPADAPAAGESVPSWQAAVTPVALTLPGRRDWWHGAYGQWTTATVGGKGVAAAAVRFARMAEAAGWTVALRAGMHVTGEDTSVGVWEVECTGMVHDNHAGGQSLTVLSLMWVQRTDGGRWTFDRERSAGQQGDRELSAYVTLADWERAAKTARPVPLTPEADGDDDTDGGDGGAPVAPAGGDGPAGGGDTELSPPAIRDDTAGPVAPVLAYGPVPDSGVICAGQVFRPVIGRRGPYAGTVLVSNAWRVEAARAAVERARVIEADRREWDANMSDLMRAIKAGEIDGPDDTARVHDLWERAGSQARAARDRSRSVRIHADQVTRDWDESRARLDAAREHAARVLDRGEVPEGATLIRSADGRGAYVIAGRDEFATPDDERFHKAWQACLFDAVAVRDAGKVPKSTGVPTKKHQGRGPGSAVKAAIGRASRPLVSVWKGPKLKSTGEPLTIEQAEQWSDAEWCVAETRTDGGVWIPAAASLIADTAAGNGWSVAMERRHGGTIIVRAAGQTSTGRQGECVAVFRDGHADDVRTGAVVNTKWISGRVASVLKTVGQTAAAPGDMGAVCPGFANDGSDAGAPVAPAEETAAPVAPAAPVASAPVVPVTYCPECRCFEVRAGRCDGCGTPEAEWIPWEHPATVVPATGPDAYGYDVICPCGVLVRYPYRSEADRVRAAHEEGTARLYTWNRHHVQDDDQPTGDDVELSPPAIRDQGTAGLALPGVDGFPVRPEPEAWPAILPAQDRETLAPYADDARVLDCLWAVTVTEQIADALGCDESADWSYTAVERTGIIGLSLEDGDDQDAERHAWEARRDVAAGVVGALVDAGWVYSPAAFEALPEDVRALLTEHAAPYPVRWLFPRPTPESERVLIPFHGPGGWSYGIRHVLRATDVDIVGIDLEPGAVATAHAAGFECVHGDMSALDPEHPALKHCTGQVPSPPCQGFTGAGLGKGRTAHAVETICGVIRQVPGVIGLQPTVDAHGVYAGMQTSGQSWAELREDLETLDDPRPGLMVEVVVWAAGMIAGGGDLRWIAMEQSDRLPAPILHDLCDALRLLGFRTIETETLDATVHGAASHRKRLFVLAFLGDVSPAVSLYPERPMPQTSFAKLTGWDESVTVNTRGQRGINPKTGKLKGGGSFPAWKVSTCITATSYGWTNSATGERMTQADINRAVGFPGTFPMQHVGRGEGIRNKAQRAADVVATPTAAAVIGRAIGRPWEAPTREYVETLYGHEPEPETVTAETVTPLAIEAAPRRLELTGGEYAKAYAEVIGRQDAEHDTRRAAALRWCKPFADVVRAADRSHLFTEDDGQTFRTIGAVGKKGRPVKAERVRLLTGAGFLYTAPTGMVHATPDGVEALRILDANPGALLSERDAMAAVRKAKRARQWDSPAGQEANALPLLPGGETERDRREGARRLSEQWGRESLERQARAEREQAMRDAQDAHDMWAAAEESAREAERAYCRECAGVYPVEARCGDCRDRHAAGLPLWDGLALPAGRPVTGRAWWEPCERVTLAGRAGRTAHSRIGSGAYVRWDDGGAGYVDPAALWVEGTEPAPVASSVRVRVAAVRPVRRRPVVRRPAARLRVAIPAPRTVPVALPIGADPATPGGLLAGFDAEWARLSGAWSAVTG